MFIYIYQAIIKDIDEQSYEEKAPRWSPKGLKHRSFCPCGTGGVQPSKNMDLFLNLDALKPCSSEFLWRLHHANKINHSLNLSPCPLPRVGVSLQVQACHHGLICLVTSPHPEARVFMTSHHIGTKDAQITQEFKDLGALESGIGVKGHIVAQKKMLLESITQEMTQVLEGLCQRQVQRSNLYWLCHSNGGVEKESGSRGGTPTRWNDEQDAPLEGHAITHHGVIHPIAKEAGLFLYQVLVIAHGGGLMEAEGIG